MSSYPHCPHCHSPRALNNDDAPIEIFLSSCDGGQQWCINFKGVKKVVLWRMLKPTLTFVWFMRGELLASLIIRWMWESVRLHRMSRRHRVILGGTRNSERIIGDEEEIHCVGVPMLGEVHLVLALLIQKVCHISCIIFCIHYLQICIYIWV